MECWDRFSSAFGLERGKSRRPSPRREKTSSARWGNEYGGGPQLRLLSQTESSGGVLTTYTK